MRNLSKEELAQLKPQFGQAARLEAALNKQIAEIEAELIELKINCEVPLDCGIDKNNGKWFVLGHNKQPTTLIKENKPPDNNSL